MPQYVSQDYEIPEGVLVQSCLKGGLACIYQVLQLYQRIQSKELSNDVWSASYKVLMWPWAYLN